MNRARRVRRRIPWLSLLLLLVAYISFGWFLSAVDSVKYDLLIAVAAGIGLAILFMHPLTSFSRFLDRWFKSDTVAFGTICMIAGLVAVILFWMHIFLYILTILAATALARIDIQISNFPEHHAFSMLSVTALVGLGLGWVAREYGPHLLLALHIPLHLPAILSTVGAAIGLSG